MEFNGSFELDDVNPDDAWIMLSDPIAVRSALRGCKFITEMDEDFSFDEYEPEENVATLPEADPDVVAKRVFEEGKTYAALLQVGVGSVKPRFESRITIDERDEENRHMVATGRGNASNSRFEMESWMTVNEMEGGSEVEWGAEANISGRIAQLGGRVINPVADKIVNDFFNNVEDQINAVEQSNQDGITKRLRDMI
ncbi:MAG: CoxG family protein [Halobacteriaceae archaeon]